MRDSGWTGRILLERTAGLFIGEGGVTPMHAHHSFKVVIPLMGAAQVVSAARGPLRGQVQVVRPNEPHIVHAQDAHVALIFVEPQGRLGRCLAWHEQRTEGRWAAAQVDSLMEPLLLSENGTLPSTDSLLSELTRQAPLPVFDRRISRAIDRLDQDVDAETRIPELAESLGLSASRLSHLFSEHMGISMVRYRRWRSLRLAMNQLAAGASVTTAAHATGFADAAHLCRSFVQMMGITPGVFRRMSLVSEAPRPAR